MNNLIENTDLAFMLGKIRECNDLKAKVKQLEADNKWLKKVVELALGDRVLVISNDEIEKMREPAFELSENCSNDLIVRIVKTQNSSLDDDIFNLFKRR